MRYRASSRSRGWARAGAWGLALLLVGCAPEAEETEPRVISVESPFQYPVPLWDERVEGETIVMVHVTEVGSVDSVYVLEPSGQLAFDSAAVAGAYQLEFAPGRRGDRRIAAWARLPVRFRMAESGEGVIR